MECPIPMTLINIESKPLRFIEDSNYFVVHIKEV